MKKRDISRRNFLKTTSAAAPLIITGGCGILSPNSKRQPNFVSPNEKLNIASVGIGGKGRSDIAGVSSENIVALCDVDMARAVEQKKGKESPTAFDMHPKAEVFTDYRKMLDKLGDSIDAVTISTPDHMHFLPAMRAMEMGKHVFVQKPLTHTLWEARQLTEAARKYGVATVMGNQGHAGEGIRLVREWVQAGTIGDVKEVHLWTNRPIWPQGLDRPTEVQAVPDTLDWNLWLGTAPKRPFNETYLPFSWRGWWDFGCGALGDMACHIMDCAYWALDLDKVNPTSITAESPPVNNESAPNWSIVTYEFPARGTMPPVTVKWYDGGKLPPRPRELEKGRELPTNGQLIVGDKATIYNTDPYCKSPRIIPETKMKAMTPSLPPKTIPRIDGGNHYQEWIRACKGGVPAGSNFDYAGPFTETVLLGNLAIRSGKKIQWDGDALKVTNVKSANKYVRTKLRNF